MPPNDLDAGRGPRSGRPNHPPDRDVRRRVARASNVLLAGYLAYFAYESVAHGSDVWLPIRVLEGLTTGLLAVLMLFRSAPVAAQWNAWAILAVIVSNGHGFAFAGGGDTPAGLELACRVTMTLAAAWACVARLCLGRNFAILPALRELRTRGPYAIVRHPIYLSLIVFDVATVGVYPSAWNAGVAAAGILAHVARVEIEERFLGREPSYVAYRSATPHRLVPFVW